VRQDAAHPCCSRLNARKHAVSVLDPFLIQPGWFQLELVAFQVHPDRTLPKPLQVRIQRTIDRLRLDDFRDDRAEDAEQYWSRDVSLRVLKLDSPFVAYELMQQGRLNTGDAW